LARGQRERLKVEGRNVRSDYRWGDANPGRIRAQAFNPDVILVSTSLALQPLQQQTRSIPIVVVQDRTGTKPASPRSPSLPWLSIAAANNSRRQVKSWPGARATCDTVQSGRANSATIRSSSAGANPVKREGREDWAPIRSRRTPQKLVVAPRPLFGRSSHRGVLQFDNLEPRWYVNAAAAPLLQQLENYFGASH
jgi:hypothetical protein